jgi:endonuclease/exonuclease/phosphatase family metal-dependent hydrolase/UDP-2,3-diacylglucosamine pyrophosphatase LpxH
LHIFEPIISIGTNKDFVPFEKSTMKNIFKNKKMKRYKGLLFLTLCAFLLVSCWQEKEVELKVLQLNTWYGGERVPEGLQGMIDIIDRTNPDIVLLCEVHKLNMSKSSLPQQLMEELGKRGKTYYSDGKEVHTGVLSKYKMENTSVLIPTPERNRTTVKTFLTVNGRTVVVYSTHLDHLNYATYLPRGYSGTTWQKIDAPVINPDSILVANRKSWRDETIRGFLADAATEVAEGHIVILGGDFNEPSHLDWQADTKDIRDHRGAVVNWDVSQMLQGAGYVDSYRSLYPNALTHPAFTWPAGNVSAKLRDLYFTPDADERDRIDFIYYHPQPGVKLTNAGIVGPSASVDHGVITPSDSKDIFIEPESVWASDHKGNLATFRIASAKPTAKVANTCPKTKLTFAFLTDTHMKRGHDHDRLTGFNQALEKVKQTDATFVLFGGDLMENSGSDRNSSLQQADSMFAAFKQTMDNSGLKYYPAIGNHDRYFDAEHPNGDEVFKKYFKDSYYTFEQQGVRFFVLNDVEKGGVSGYVVGEKQMNWLKQELIHVPLATPVVVALHVPVYSLYYPALEGKHIFVDMVSNFQDLLKTFREHNLKLVLQGHQHIYEEIYSQQVQYITGGSVCAAWWTGSFYGNEEGFLLVEVDETDNFHWKYVDYGWSPK